jgi:GNAT superfamily N-acetyltransferase
MKGVSRKQKARKAEPELKLEIRPLTAELWPALEGLFGPLGACNGCWCMYGRIGANYRKRPRESNKADFRAVVKKGPPPGLLAFDSKLAVGWCQLTPRDAVPHLEHLWRLKRVDNVPVWCISCFYVRIGYRRKGINAALIQAAIEHARRAGAPALEAYPIDRRVSPSATSTGFATSFIKAGFKEIARYSQERPIMRIKL